MRSLRERESTAWVGSEAHRMPKGFVTNDFIVLRSHWFSKSETSARRRFCAGRSGMTHPVPLVGSSIEVLLDLGLAEGPAVDRYQMKGSEPRSVVEEVVAEDEAVSSVPPSKRSGSRISAY